MANSSIRINRIKNLLSVTQFTEKINPKERRRNSLSRSKNNLSSSMNDQVLLRKMKGKI